MRACAAWPKAHHRQGCAASKRGVALRGVALRHPPQRGLRAKVGGVHALPPLAEGPVKFICLPSITTARGPSPEAILAIICGAVHTYSRLRLLRST